MSGIVEGNHDVQIGTNMWVQGTYHSHPVSSCWFINLNLPDDRHSLTTISRLPCERVASLPMLVLAMGSGSCSRVTVPGFDLRLRLAYNQDKIPAIE